jgi:hypothetical protein
MDFQDRIWEFEREILKPFLSHVTMNTFTKPTPEHWLLFPYCIQDNKVTPLSAIGIAKTFPRTWTYFKKNEPTLRGREGGKANNDHWFEYIYRKNLTIFEDPKLIVQVISKTGQYSYDSDGCYFTGGGNGPYYGIRLKQPRNSHSLHYLQALLSSTLLDFCLHSISTPFRGGYWSYGKRFIEQLPIRTIDFSDPADKTRHDRIVRLVESMLVLHKQLALAQTDHEKTALQRQIDATDRQIDQLVYELYGLTDEEIRIVEESQGGLS